MKAVGATHKMNYEYFVLQIDGHAKSGYRRFTDALKAALRLEDQFPDHNVKVRAIRQRRRRRMLLLSVEVHEDDLREIARRGYEDAATTDRRRQAEAVSLFVSDTLRG